MSKKKQSAEEMIEELAISVGKGFEATATQDDVKALAAAVREGFSAMSERLERIEFHLTDQGPRIEVLEDRVHQLARKVGLEFK